jgi:DNA anti-recombination protein RmuC
MIRRDSSFQVPEAQAIMANTPKKQEQSDDVLAALEEALSSQNKEPGASEAGAKTPEAKTSEAKASDAKTAGDKSSSALANADDRFVQESQNDRIKERAGARTKLPLGAANDDRQTVGQILAKMHRTPSRTPYLVATVLSILWATGQLLYARARYGEEFAAMRGISQFFDQPFFVPLIALIALPIIAFFAFAAFYRRSQQMHFVASAMAEITSRFAEPEGIASDAFVSVGQQIRREVAALGDGMERAVARAAELETVVRAEVATLERAYDENEARVRALVENLQGERDSIVTHAQRLQESIVNVHHAFNIDVEGVSEKVNNSITEVTNRVIDNFITQTHSARAHINAAGDEVVHAFLGRSQEAADNLSQVGNDISNSVAERGLRTMEELRQAAERFTESLTERGDTVKENLIERLQQLEDAIVLRGSEVADRVMSDSAALSAQIAKGLANFDDTVKVHGAKVAADIVKSAEQVNETTKQSFLSLDQRLVGKATSVAAEIDQRISRVEKTLDERTKTLNETLANRTLEFARTITDGSKLAKEAVDNSLAGMGDYFSSKAQEIAGTLSERTDAINQVLGSRALEMTQGLDTRVARFEEMVVNRLENVANSVETKSIAAADVLAAKIEETTAGLRSEAAEVERSFTQLADRVSTTLVDRAREVTAAHETLQSNVSGVLERLNDANTQLKGVLASVVDNLGPIEGAVGDKITEFRATLESTINNAGGAITHMDSQLREMRDVSNKMIGDVSALTTRFEDQGRFLVSAVDTMSETHRRIDATLAERREAIEALTGHLSTRSSDLEDRLTRFNRLLEEQLAGAEAKAQEIARLVADTTTNATQSIVKQYDAVKNTANEERDRTSLALRSVYENATNEVNTLFRDMNQRFVDVARELREVATEVQHSLDQTRQELKRGVFELPHETRESTAAMRRLVADQIKALAELNEVVSRHSRGVDNAAAPRRLAVNEDALIAAATEAPRDALRARADFAPPTGRPRVEALPSREREAIREIGREIEREARELPRRPAPGPRWEERMPQEVHHEARHESWGGETLLRARQDEEPRAPRRVREEEAASEEPALRSIESLDALSADIARLVDHDAAVELWERHNRGEKNAFTRRLYTTQGQKTFEDIRRKYRRSSEFRETVDRYIEEFERLLDQVGRDDRGQVLTRTYLASDTGKVYTLLAHASGRLG